MDVKFITNRKCRFSFNKAAYCLLYAPGFNAGRHCEERNWIYLCMHGYRIYKSASSRHISLVIQGRSFIFNSQLLRKIKSYVTLTNFFCILKCSRRNILSMVDNLLFRDVSSHFFYFYPLKGLCHLLSDVYLVGMKTLKNFSSPLSSMKFTNFYKFFAFVQKEWQNYIAQCGSFYNKSWSG